MHRELGASIRHVREQIYAQARDRFGCGGARLDGIIAGLKRGAPCSPATFAHYYRLTAALLAGDDAGAARELSWLADARPWTGGMRVDGLGNPDTDAEAALYAALMAGDPTSGIGFAPPSASDRRAFDAAVRAGLDLMQRAAPALWGEFRGLVRHVIGVRNPPGATMQFDGGSHYQLWGALFLSVNPHVTPDAMVEVLAHESAHSLLFGLCIDETLVENPDDELHASPLRIDPRPMDGIYHATFVSARMHWAMSRLLASGLLDAAAVFRVTRARDADRSNFMAGHEVVARHGRLTPTGSALMDAALAYMRSPEAQPSGRPDDDRSADHGGP